MFGGQPALTHLSDEQRLLFERSSERGTSIRTARYDLGKSNQRDCWSCAGAASGSALVALLDPHEEHHRWARETLLAQALPWLTCESVLSEALFVLREPYARALDQLLRADHLRLTLDLREELIRVVDLRARFASVPMSLADACLVRLSEILPNSVL